ncbi:MAG: glycosyltransferase family 2 protein [Puniceicoccales bacterium]
MQNPTKISLVIPCFNEAGNLQPLIEELKANQIPQFSLWEYIFVDDGSSDDTVSILRSSSRELSGTVRIIEFSRNFGKESAILAGLEHSTGDVTVVMDADLQDPPSLLGSMIQAITEEGFDMAATHRVDRSDEPAVRSLFSHFFYRVWNWLTPTRLRPGARDFRAMSRAVVNCVVALRESNRFSKGIFEWVGFRTKYIPYENRARRAGESGWSLRGLMAYALDGLFSFSILPLRFASVCGVTISFFAFIWMAWVILKTLLFGDPVAGYPSLVTILLFVSGIQLLCLGLIGEYLGRTYQETKARPHYLVRQVHEVSEN